MLTTCRETEPFPPGPYVTRRSPQET